MSAGPPTTSLQRTYRYLRLAIGGSVVVVFTAIGVAMPSVGLLHSISQYYYSPAGPLFVAALVALSVCFFALSGWGAERILLDIAAVIVPVVAFVPTPIAPHSVPGVDAGCPNGARSCVPTGYDAIVDNGVATYLIVGVVIGVVAGVLAWAGEVDRRATLWTMAIAAGILCIVWLTWWLAHDVFLRWAHLVAAVCFFGLIAVVAVVNAATPSSGSAPRWLRGTYIAIAVALSGVVIAIPLYDQAHPSARHAVLVGEVVALVLFAAFWILQSIEHWRTDDPAILARK